MAEKVSTKRDSSIELLRIIAVIMVITTHYLGAGEGGILSAPFTYDFNHVFALITECLTLVGVNLFVLITGYYGISQKGINLRRIVGIILLVSFWGILLFAHALASGTPFSMKGLLKSVLPYLFGSMWYIRVYLLLILISPFLNVMMNSLTLKALRVFIILSLVLFSVLPSFLKAFKNAYGYDIIHFTLIYSIGAYIRIGIHKLPSKRICLAAFLFFSAITVSFFLFGNGDNYWGYDFITCVISSVALFTLFVQMHFSSSLINRIARTVLGVYILNISFPYLYTKFIIREPYFNSNFFLLHFSLSVFGFFVAACILELIRLSLFSVTIDPLLKKIGPLNKRYLSDIQKR